MKECKVFICLFQLFVAVVLFMSLAVLCCYFILFFALLDFLWGCTNTFFN